jgi:DNA-binding CsgD family transcriptional regulator
MARQRTEFVGRREELDALRWDRGEPALKVVRGAAGRGKSAVLKQFCTDMRASGILVLEVSGTAGHPAWDLFGIQVILGAVRDQFERIDSDPRLAASISALSRLCVPDGYTSAWGRFCLLHALHTLFTRIGANGPVVLMVDDADRLPQPVHTLSAVHRAGHLIVASCTGTPLGDPTELDELADQTVDLGPLPAEDVDSLLRLIARVPVDDALRAALKENLGPLYGNPGTLVSTVADLRARGRLVAVHGHLCLRDPAEPIVLARGQHHLAEVDALGDLARDLVVLAAAPDGFTIDEIPVLAATSGRSPAEYGRVADELVLAGVLDHDSAGRLRCHSRALGNAVTRQAGEDEVRHLHRSIAEQALRPGARTSPELAGHVAAAGASMAPRPGLAELLTGVAGTILDPHRHAAHLYAAWWHSEPGLPRTRLGSQLVRLLVRSARYARLAEFVAEVAGDDRPGATLSPGERAELAMAASLAAIHCGRPVSGPVLAALTGDGATPAPLGFCDRWFAGLPMKLDEIVSCFAPVWLRHESFPPTMAGRIRRRRHEDVSLKMAVAVRDLVPAFESVLGSDYRVPVDGPVAAYHRVCQGYATGQWGDALSAARELRLTNADVESGCRASLLAAEMCGWRGEDRLAAEWLAEVPTRGAFPVLRGWAAIALSYHDGDLAGALELGWEAYRLGGPEGAAPGSSRLLRRLSAIAMEAGRPYWARCVLAEAEARHDRLDTAESLETALYVRGVVQVEAASAQVSERISRVRGNRVELALACQAAGNTSNRPHPWMQEAYEIARDVGASRLISRTKRSLEACGGAVPVARVRHDDLSAAELRIIALIRNGKTNRQIALEVQMSEKTVEKHLTRLFAKAGCRTRHGLATSGLGGRLEQVGA